MTEPDAQSADGSWQCKEDNDDWEGTSETWGETFFIRLETTGNEAVGEVVDMHGENAIDQRVRQDDTGFFPDDVPPSPGDIQDNHVNKAFWVGEKARTELTFATTERELLNDEWRELAERVGEALPDDWELSSRGDYSGD